MYKTGGGATWLGGTYDPDTKLVFFGTGNPAPWNSWLRPGDNKWTVLPHRHRSGKRRAEVGLPDHPA